MKRKARKWFKLDNAAKIYPAVRTSNWASMYRISITLDRVIDPRLLQMALNDVLKRFPSFKVRLRSGFFWYYLEEIESDLTVEPEVGHPLLRIKPNENGGYMMRVLYYDQRMSIEVFHAISDGTGSLLFMRTLVARYLHYCGIEIPNTNGVKDINETPPVAELEDAYSRVPTEGTHTSRVEPKAYRLSGMREMPHTLHVVVGHMSLAKVKEKAKQYGVTVNEYMVAVILYSLNRIQMAGKSDKRRPVKIQVPVNMRRFIPSETVRNFAFYVNMGLDPCLGTYTFEEVLQLTHHYIRYYTNPKFLYAGIAPNVASERNPILRACPLFIKNLVLGLVFSQVGETLFTTVLTNLGPLDMPDEMRPYVKDVQVLLGPGKTARSNASLITLGDQMSLCMTRNLREATLEKAVMSFLVEQGIEVTVLSNQE